MISVEIEGELTLSNDSTLVLNGFSTTPRGMSNLRLIDSHGEEQWGAELPESMDSYVSVEDHGGRLWATTFSGFRVELEPASGRLISATFVK